MGFGTQNGHAVAGGEGGDFGDLDDGIYVGEILNISDTYEDTYEGKTSTKVTIEFAILPEHAGQEVPDGYTRTYWLTLTKGFLQNGAVSDNSNLYGLLEALGYNMAQQPIAFDSDEWVGRRVRVDITHSPKTGYPKISGFKKPLTKKAAAPAPAAAGGRRAASYE